MPSLRRPSPAPRAAAAGPADSGREVRDARLAEHLRAASAGSASAFEAFYEATFAFARTVARRMLRGAEVEDLLADAYFEAWRHAARFDPTRGSAVTWLLTLVRSRALDALRAGAGSAAVGPDEPEDEPAPADTDPAEQLWRHQCTAELQRALGTLSGAERWVLGLAYLRELSHAEISRCTGMPLGTVKSHALRAQGKLRAAFAASGGGARPARTA